MSEGRTDVARPSELATSARAGWAVLDRPCRHAVLVGGALVVVGLGHLLAYAVVGGDWFGPLGWRKPFAFGVSFGLTTATLGVAAGSLLRGGTARRWACYAVAAANVSEVAWVSIQRARGVPSHFNFDTAFDTGFFIANGVAIAVTVAVITILAVRAFQARDLDPAMAVAWQVGLVVLLVSMSVGGWMISMGIAAADAGTAANLTTVAPAGQLKVPHAIGMHAIQVLPVLAWLLGRTGTPTVKRQRLVITAASGYVVLTSVGLAQAAAGRALEDPGAALAILAAVGIALMVWAYVAALWTLPRGHAPS